jgi:carbonic anhydrase
MKKINTLFLLSFYVFSSFSFAEEITPYAIVNAVNQLKSGNERYIKGKMNKYDHVVKRDELAKGQEPYAIVVCCSDSRVSPEYIFDASLGSIFVVRTAGNVIDEVALGSIEYAAEHLHSKVLLVMGHEACGAVKASISGKTESPNINAIIDKITPSVSKSKKIAKEEQVKFVTDMNVGEQINYIKENSKIIEELMHENKISILGGYYNFKSGVVDYLEIAEEAHSAKESKHKESKEKSKKSHK